MIWYFFIFIFSFPFSEILKKTQNHFIKWNQDDHDFNDDSFKFNFFEKIQHLLFHFWFFILFNQTALISEIRSMCHDSKFKILSMSKSIMRTTSSRSGGLFIIYWRTRKIENYELRWYSRWITGKKQMIFKINLIAVTTDISNNRSASFRIKISSRSYGILLYNKIYI